MRHSRRLLVALAVLTSSANAAAQELDSDTPSEPRKALDKVYLEGGTVIAGEVVEQKKGEFVVVRMENGETNRIDWAIVEKVVLAKAGGAGAAPPKAGGKTSAKKPKKPARCEEGDEDCEATTTTGPSAKGVGVGIQGERVVRLKTPGNHYTQLAIDGGFLYGTSTKSSAGSLSIYGGGANLNLTYRIGGKLPDENGGTWSALGIDVYAGIFGAGVVAGNTGAGMLLVSGGGALGYQFFAFGAMNEESFKQHGIGFFLGGRAGVANSNIWFQGGSQSNTSAQYGPQITVTFPTYNFGTAERAAFYLSAFVLPTGDFLFVNIQAGGAFSL